MSNFDRNLEYGSEREILAINYLTQELGYNFIGGDVSGQIVNQKEIERICNCLYIPIKKGTHGSQLKFFDKDENAIIVTMPDELLVKESSGKFRWMEVKSSRKIFPSEKIIQIEERLVNDYNFVEELSRVPVFIVFVENVMEGWSTVNLRYCSPKDILNLNNKAFSYKNGIYYIEYPLLPRINKQSFSIDDYC